MAEKSIVRTIMRWSENKLLVLMFYPLLNDCLKFINDIIFKVGELCVASYAICHCIWHTMEFVINVQKTYRN